jgi:hypothetical protein
MAQTQKTGKLFFTVDTANDRLIYVDGPNTNSFAWSDVVAFANGTQSIRSQEILVQIVEQLIFKGTNLSDVNAVKTDLELPTYKLLN